MKRALGMIDRIDLVFGRQIGGMAQDGVSAEGIWPVGKEVER